MRKLAIALAGIASAALAGSAYAATSNHHVMNVPLPDGSTVHVEYVGDVAPRVRIESAPLSGVGQADMGMWSPTAFPSFPDFGRMMQQMQRETQAMIRQVHQMPHQAAGGPAATASLASYGNAVPGSSSYSVVSVTNGGGTCTRTTEIVSRGAGKSPKVTSSVKGTCGPATAPNAAPAGPVNRT